MSLRSLADYSLPDVDQVTHRNSRSVPIHRWYPFVEGYSPGYVEGILDTYAPSARRILDPFAGTGTTALVASGRGLIAYYCELNPILQILTEANQVQVFVALLNSSAEPNVSGGTERAITTSSTSRKWSTAAKPAIGAHCAGSWWS